jgi:hypothetical protein
MNPADLVTPHLIDHCRNFNTIVILGHTKTGKVTIAEKLASQLGRPLFKSDDYIDYDNRENSLYTFIDGILPYYNNRTPIIVEGITCFRLLRKGIQTEIFHPDLVIKTKCSDATIKHFYEKDGEGAKVNRVLSFNKGLNKIWDEYISLLSSNIYNKLPQYIELETSLPQYRY